MNTPALRARILAEWAKGKSALEIARELALTEGRVAGIINYSRGPEAEQANRDHYRNAASRAPKPTKSRESVKREAHVLALWAAGDSAADISAAFGVTRNVVMGIIHRSKGEDAEAAKRAHAVMGAERPKDRPRNPHQKPIKTPAAAKIKPPALTAQTLAQRREQQAAAGRALVARIELTLIDNPAFVAKVEKPRDAYAHMWEALAYDGPLTR